MLACADLDVGKQVERVPATQLTALSFYRDFVARNKPVIITGAIDGWPALQKWSKDYICQRLGEAQVRAPHPITAMVHMRAEYDIVSHAGDQVTVSVTPDGRADSVTQLGSTQVFALPAEERMPVGQLFDGLQGGPGRVMYAQAQDNRCPHRRQHCGPDALQYAQVHGDRQYVHPIAACRRSLRPSWKTFRSWHGLPRRLAKAPTPSTCG